MGELTLFIMRMAFLAILWIFVFVIIVALRSDLFGQRVRKLPATETVPSAAPPARTAPSAGGVIASRLVITAGAKGGLQIDLPEEVLTIGALWGFRTGDSRRLHVNESRTNHAHRERVGSRRPRLDKRHRLRWQAHLNADARAPQRDDHHRHNEL